MARIAEPVIIHKRGNSFQFTLNSTCGLPRRVCAEWQRRSFKTLPEELSLYRNPKTKPEAKANIQVLIAFLKKKLEARLSAKRPIAENITVGDWLMKFTRIETSPRTGRNAAKNRPYSPDTLDTYRTYFNAHIKDDPFAEIKMSEVEEEDVTVFSNRLSLKKKDGKPLGGTRTSAGVIIFIRMAFKEYQKKHKRWVNPFIDLDPPQLNTRERDALPEEEVLKLFYPGVLQSSMEIAVCAIMFLSGLRRAEIAALKPDCLDWVTPKITVRNTWQKYDNKSRVYGPTKSKKERDAPFDPILQQAIKKMWEENGKHEYVFCHPDGSILKPSWIRRCFPEWLKRAGIELGGREIVPHSARHSLASLLEERGISLRYIQDMLGHSDLKTTMGYLHSTEATIRTIGKKINEAMQQEPDENIVEFKTS